MDLWNVLLTGGALLVVAWALTRDEQPAERIATANDTRAMDVTRDLIDRWEDHTCQLCGYAVWIELAASDPSGGVLASNDARDPWAGALWAHRVCAFDASDKAEKLQEVTGRIPLPSAPSPLNESRTRTA